MIRRFNYAGRRRIPRSRVRIRVADDGPRRRFDAELALQGLDLPEDANLALPAFGWVKVTDCWGGAARLGMRYKELYARILGIRLRPGRCQPPRSLLVDGVFSQPYFGRAH